MRRQRNRGGATPLSRAQPTHRVWCARQVTQLKAANERLQQRLAMLELRLNSESTASMPSPHPPALPPRVASSNHSINVRTALCHPPSAFCNSPSAQVSSPLEHEHPMLPHASPVSRRVSRCLLCWLCRPQTATYGHQEPARAVPRALWTHALL